MVTSTVDARLRQRVDQPPELPPRQRVDAAGRLVEEQDRRLVQDRAAEREPLAPAAGEIARQRVLAAGEAGHLEHERAPLGSSRAPVEAVDAAEEADVLIDGQQLVEREPLRHVADALLHAFRIAGDVDAADERACRTSAAAARTACGWSSTCRRRCCRGSRRSRPRATSKRHVVDGDELRRSGGSGRGRRWRAPRRPRLGRHGRPSARSSRASASRGAGQRARAFELGLQHGDLARRARRCWSRRRRVKRSPTTRRASAALRTPSAAAAIAARRRVELEPPLPDLERDLAIELGDARVSGAGRRPRLPPAPRGARPPSHSVQVTLTETSQESSHSVAAREDARVRARVVVAAADRDLRPCPPPRPPSPRSRGRVGAAARARAARARCAARLGDQRVRPTARHGAIGSSVGGRLERRGRRRSPMQPPQIGLRDRALRSAPRSPAAAGATRCASADEHVVGRNQARVEAARARRATCASSAVERSLHDPLGLAAPSPAPRTRARSRAAGRRAPRPGPRRRPRAPRARRVRARRRGRRCRSATADRAGRGSCRARRDRRLAAAARAARCANSSTWLVRV